MKKIYKLLIMFDTDEEECEVLSETVDTFNDTDNDELLTVEDYEDKNLRDVLIKAQIMGSARRYQI